MHRNIRLWRACLNALDMLHDINHPETATEAIDSATSGELPKKNNFFSQLSNGSTAFPTWALLSNHTHTILAEHAITAHLQIMRTESVLPPPGIEEPALRTDGLELVHEMGLSFDFKTVVLTRSLWYLAVGDWGTGACIIIYINYLNRVLNCPELGTSQRYSKSEWKPLQTYSGC